MPRDASACAAWISTRRWSYTSRQRGGRSSAGRASRSQCEGQEFDPPRLHQYTQLVFVYLGDRDSLMEGLFSLLPIIFAAISVGLLIVVVRKLSNPSDDKTGILIREEFRATRKESAEASRELREEVAGAQKSASEAVVSSIGEMAKNNEARLDKLRETLDGQMRSLQESNEKKLDQMRQTVDEKLQNTLEKRLGESFKIVSDRLEAVHRGLGDMQNLAGGVGDLKRMLTNVKARGTWGEFQLGDILEQILTPSQYAKNVQPNSRSGETVEYAVRLPGARGDEDSTVWLPIDSKFPQEDYQRLIDAEEIADSDAVEKSRRDLIRAIEKFAKDINSKYIDPPQTTDFAIMFLPTEGLYSEVLRYPGLGEKLQNEYRVTVAGPTTLSALLNSLRMGFRTLAIEKRSSEVWNILAAVKTEFGKFEEILTKVKKQLDTASNTIDQTSVRTRSMERKLREVEELPAKDSIKLLGLDKASLVEADDETEE
ncbi:uncharacterized protein METZ01_LOCUS137749 [marine metagenome]|uniref:DNA recombination protein RmuC n=1 Tax=marine metagenome TaxID=408172 RepID=A0A381Z6G5_9ZZZZ